jgi:glycosyltransferase involved in cell wall biosynthesis
MKNINNIISIITPTLNSEKYFEETILSVLSQAGDFIIDYIVIDGASTDRTLEIIKKYEKLIRNKNFPLLCTDIYFKWMSEKDSGMYEALNKGFLLARGDIMTYMNSDDKLVPGSLAAVSEIFNSFIDINWLTGCPLVCEDGFYYSSDSRRGFFKKFIQKGYYHEKFSYFIQQEGTFWTSDLWQRSGSFLDEKYKLAGDFELWTRFAKYEKLYLVLGYLGIFRKHMNQLMAVNRDKYYEEIEKINNKKIGNPEKMIIKIFHKIKLNRFMPYIYYDHNKERWIKKF